MRFIQEVISTLGPEILRKSGASFYSDITTLQKGKYLILGLNPGGDPAKELGTIENSFNVITELGYNEYFNAWLPDGKKHRLQENLKELFRWLGADLKKICATNLVYERSKTERELSLEKLPIYRKILDMTIAQVKPEVIVSYGKRPLSELKNYFSVSESDITKVDSEHGKWMVQFIKVERGGSCIKIVGLPHLSIYTIYGREKVLGEIKRFIACT